jgi:histidinol-phosphate aminotransferase
MDSLIRPAVAAMPDYDAGGFHDDGVLIRAHRNESALEPPDSVLRAIRMLDGAALRCYPAELFHSVTCALARKVGASPKCLAIGSGADDILIALGRAVLNPGDIVVTVAPTFGMYARIAAMAGAELRTLAYPRRWELDAEALLRLAVGAKLVILGHPNNPTGDALDEQMLAVLAHALPQALIAVDEVYLAFSCSSLVASVAALPNVALVGSFSKVAALAGLRIGYAVAHPSVATALRRVMPPFPIGVASLVAAAAYIRGDAPTAAFEAALAEHTNRSLDAIVAEVGCFAENVWPSLGNFVLMDFGRRGEAFAAALRLRGIAVRAFSEPELFGCLRFSALDELSTERLITAVQDAAGTLGMRVVRA